LPKPTDIELVIGRARRYCAFQERSTKELSDKLKAWKVIPAMTERVIKQMVKEGYLDEERFARAFASGRFRLKHWGKTKIQYELRGRKVPDEIIQLAMDEIDEEEYKEILLEVIKKKNKEINVEDQYARKKKLTSFALQKGYEYEVIREAIEKLLK
jgi:regulatory protein